MAMAAATTIGAAHRFRCGIGLCPCLFGGTGSDQKKTVVVHCPIFPSHLLDHSIPHINRIKSHVAFLISGERHL